MLQWRPADVFACLALSSEAVTADWNSVCMFQALVWSVQGTDPPPVHYSGSPVLHEVHVNDMLPNPWPQSFLGLLQACNDGPLLRHCRCAPVCTSTWKAKHSFVVQSNKPHKSTVQVFRQYPPGAMLESHALRLGVLWTPSVISSSSLVSSTPKEPRERTVNMSSAPPGSVSALLGAPGFFGVEHSDRG